MVDNSHEDRIRQLEYNKTLKGFTLTNPTISGAQFDVPTGYRNRIINGDFTVAQRGTVFTPPASSQTWTLDRWLIGNGTGATTTISQAAFAPGSALDRGFTLSWNRSVAGGSDSFLDQRIEGVETLNGQTVTLAWNSFSAGVSVDYVIDIIQVFGTGGSPSGIVTTSSPTFTSTPSSFGRNTWTFTVPSISGKTLGTNNDHNLIVRFRRNWNAVNGATGNMNIYFVQFEAGSVATPFEQRPPATEFALCRRYFKRFLFTRWPVNGVQPSSINAHFPCDDMRTVPTIALGGGAVWNDTSFSNGGGPGANQWGLVLEGVVWITRTGTLACGTSVDRSSAKIVITGGASMTNMPSDLATDGGTMWVDLTAEL